MRWTGAGIPAGNAVSSANVNDANNGDSVSFSTSGTGTCVKAGDGLDISGTTTFIKRINTDPYTATTCVVWQFFFTPGETPSATIGWVELRNAVPGQNGQMVHYTDGKFGVFNATGGTVAALTTTIAMVNGHRYKIDGAADTNSATIGRIFYRAIDLTDPTWNTTGYFFGNSGFAINTAASQNTFIRFGRDTGSSTITTPSRLERFGWEPRASLSSSATQAVLETEFMSDPYYPDLVMAARSWAYGY